MRDVSARLSVPSAVRTLRPTSFRGVWESERGRLEQGHLGVRVTVLCYADQDMLQVELHHAGSTSWPHSPNIRGLGLLLNLVASAQVVVPPRLLPLW